MTRRADLPCADCGRLMWRSWSTLPAGQARCLPCRRANVIFSHGETGYTKHRCRCAICTAAVRDLARAVRAKRKSETGLAQKRRASRIYTSPDTPSKCSACGKFVFGNVKSNPMHNDCRPSHNTMWSNVIQVSRRVRYEIYKRDKWTCQICRVIVDQSLDLNDRMSATLDHIVPRSLSLFPDDSPENLRLAHRACNSARGNKAA